MPPNPPLGPVSSRNHKIALVVSICAAIVMIVGVGLAIYVLVWSGAHTQSPDRSAAQSKPSVRLGKKYISSDPSLPFSIQPPKSWLLISDPSKGTAAAFHILDNQNNELAYLSVDYSMLKSGQTLSLQQRADAEKRYIEQNNQDVKLLDYSALTLDGMPTRQIEWTDTYENVRSHTLELVVAKGEVSYYIVFSSSEQEWQQYKDIGYATTRSFRAGT